MQNAECKTKTGTAARLSSPKSDCAGFLAWRSRNRILNSNVFAERNGPVGSRAGSVSGRKESADMRAGCPHTPAGRSRAAARAGKICRGRILLSRGVLAAVEGSCSDFGDVLSYPNSSTTRQGPSAAVSTPALRMARPLGQVWNRGPFDSNCGVRRTGIFLSLGKNGQKNETFEIAVQVGANERGRWICLIHLCTSAIICAYCRSVSSATPSISTSNSPRHKSARRISGRATFGKWVRICFCNSVPSAGRGW